jgi:hypothetical protein
MYTTKLAFPLAGHGNLRPRWRPGESGNPAGRPRGSRNKRSLRAERVGKALLARAPELIELLALPPLDDPEGWQRLYRRTVAALKPNLGEDAPLAAVRRLLAGLLLLLPSPPADELCCLHCGNAIPRGGRIEYAASQSMPVLLGRGCIGWAHRGACHRLAAEKAAEHARNTLEKLLSDALREPPAVQPPSLPSRPTPTRSRIAIPALEAAVRGILGQGGETSAYQSAIKETKDRRAGVWKPDAFMAEVTPAPARHRPRPRPR